MGQMTIRSLDDRAKERLKAQAKANHRSVEAEARAILEAAVAQDWRDFAAWSERQLARFPKGVTIDVIVADVREDRDR